MRRFTFPIQLVSVVGVLLLLGLVQVPLAGDFSLVLQADEPTARPTPEPEPFLHLDPMQGIAGDATLVEVTGGFWNPGVAVTLYWDATGGTPLAVTTAGADHNFRTEFATPTEGTASTPGIHIVIAVQGTKQAEAAFQLIQPTPSDTPTPTATNTWTPTPSPTPTSTPVTPTPTHTGTPTLAPSPTLRPVTPIVSITPIPPTKGPSGPAATKTSTPTGTNTPPSETPTNTPTPSVTPTPSNTPRSATPSTTPQPTASPEATARAATPTVEPWPTTQVAALSPAPPQVAEAGSEPAQGAAESDRGSTTTRNIAVMGIILLLIGGAFVAGVGAMGVGLWLRRRRV